MAKTYYSNKNFDDDVAGLGALCVQKGWSILGVGGKHLIKDAEDQRSERTRHDELAGQFQHEHERFGQAQEARYERFASVLNALRSMHRKDKAVMAELARFKRSYRRVAKKAKVQLKAA